MSESYYISNGGEAQGPYEISQFRSMWNMGQITANSLYWKEDPQQWCSISELGLNKAPQAKVNTQAETGNSVKPANPITYWMLRIGGVGFLIGFLLGLGQASSFGSASVSAAIAFSVGYAVPLFLLSAGIGAIVGFFSKRRQSRRGI